jgi:hypothetical protein
MPILDKVKSLIERHTPPSFEDGKQQDMFMLGLTLFAVLTGVTLR